MSGKYSETREVEVTRITTIKQMAVRRKLESLLAERAEVQLLMKEAEAKRKEAEARKKKLDEEITEIMREHKMEKTVYSGWVYSRIQSSSSTISAALLLRKGVDPYIVEQATIVKEYEYLKLQEVKEV